MVLLVSEEAAWGLWSRLVLDGIALPLKEQVPNSKMLLGAQISSLVCSTFYLASLPAATVS